MLLEKLLAGLDVVVEPFAICPIPDGVRGRFGQPDCATLHYVVAGAGWLTARGMEPRRLAPHSVVVGPPDMMVEIAPDRTAGRTVPAAALCRPLTDGQGPGEGDGMVVACGRIHATYRHAAGLFDRLESPLVEDFGVDDSVSRPFDAFLAELATPQPGGAAMAEALFRQCLVVLLRRYCGSGECRLPWLSALEDPRLNRALAAMLERPEHPFTLEDLADLAGMSRSGFAAHFAAAFERPPMEYLRDLRLSRAARLLATTDLPVKTIAGRIGYRSRSHFSRAFRDRYGADPVSYRAAG